MMFGMRIQLFHTQKSELKQSVVVSQVQYSGGPGGAMFRVVGDLPAFTDQRFKVQVCNNIGCINSTEVVGRTLLSGAC